MNKDSTVVVTRADKPPEELSKLFILEQAIERKETAKSVIYSQTVGEGCSRLVFVKSKNNFFAPYKSCKDEIKVINITDITQLFNFLEKKYMQSKDN